MLLKGGMGVGFGSQRGRRLGAGHLGPQMGKGWLPDPPGMPGGLVAWLAEVLRAKNGTP